MSYVHIDYPSQGLGHNFGARSIQGALVIKLRAIPRGAPMVVWGVWVGLEMNDANCLGRSCNRHDLATQLHGGWL
jgi:hypothetical protein